MKEKVVLAYSGGLDTTAIIPWLKENFDYEVKTWHYQIIAFLSPASKKSQKQYLTGD